MGSFGICIYMNVQIAKKGKIEDHKNYVVGFLVVALSGAIISSLGSKTHDLPVIVDVIGNTIFAILFSALIAGLILSISWMFTRNFTFLRFIRVSVVICAIWALTTIISVVKNMI